ncbi:BrnT family toxin [Octadecabacter sp. CECT 8868]|nr:BrnT family toxin [Octadecabacter algicola]
MQNLAKHGADFLDAALIFEGPILTRIDDRKDYGEERRIALGMTDETVYVVTYTMRGEATRIISAWPGGRKEYEQYKTRIP